MANNVWRGDAPAVSQVEAITIGGTPAAGNTVSVTINGKPVTYTAVAGDTTTTIATNLQTLLSASTIAEFMEVGWTTSGTAVITGTANTAGIPFTYSTSATGGGATISGSNVTPSSGPNDASTAANWTTGAIPANTDVVIIDGSSDILYGLGSLGTPSLTSFTVKASFTGNIGLPRINSTGQSSYIEYRPRFFPIVSAVPISIGAGTGQGPTRVYLDAAGTLSMDVVNTGTSSVTNVPTVNVIGCTSGTLSITSGSVGLAADDDTTSATVTTCNTATGTTLTVGAGAIVTTLNQDDGTTYGYGTVTNTNILSGTAYISTTSPTAITANTGNGATVYWTGTGTLGTATFQGQGGNTFPSLNLSTDPRSRTITNGSFTGGGAIDDPNKTSTWSNAFTMDSASLGNSVLGERFSVLRS